MKVAKFIITSFLVAVFILGCSVSYAEKNDGTVFFSGRVGENTGIFNCTGNCSADPLRSIGIGLSGDHHLDPDWGIFIYRLSTSLDFSRYQFNVNGNAVNVATKALHLHLEMALKSHPRYSLVATLGPGWTTASSLNAPDRTVFAGDEEIYLLYQVTPRLYLKFGTTALFTSPPNQPDFYSSTTDLGLRWYLF